MLRLDDRWVWDAWTVDDGGRTHLFYLQAPRSLGDPSLRHVNATVGHAVSTDCVDWEVVEDALTPSDSGCDDLAIWTGSTMHDGERWRMFYTAVSRAGHHIYDQRIGSAVSDDLVHWTRVSSEPALRIDLTEVTSVDAQGRACLEALHRMGAQFVAADCLMKAVVAEITGGRS